MKKLGIALVAVLVLLVAAVLIAPSFVDWNAHKERITTAVREATGRELTIRGDIDVTILPSPALRVEDVRLSNIQGAGAPDMVRLNEARVSVAFGPLFEGRLATVVTLVEPVINLENWPTAVPVGSWRATAARQQRERPPRPKASQALRTVRRSMCNSTAFASSTAPSAIATRRAASSSG